jgi:hypothetical protein
MPAIDIGARLLELMQATAGATRRFPVAVAGCLLVSLAALLLVHDVRLAIGAAPLAEWFAGSGSASRSAGSTPLCSRKPGHGRVPLASAPPC